MTQAQYPRDIVEKGLDARIASIVEPEIEDLGFRLVRVRLSGQNGLTLQVMAERPDGMINIEECEKISRVLSPLLDIEEPVEGSYHLEISSPGIDRPLVRLSDFDMWAGHMAKVETRQAINEQKRFRGIILSTQNNKITFLKETAEKDGKIQFTLDIKNITNAKLMLTDSLIRETLNKKKPTQQIHKQNDDTT